MKLIITILAFIVTVHGSWFTGPWTPGLRVRFDFNFNLGSSYFFDIPRILSTAIAEGWTEKERYEGAPMESLVMYCYEDCVICACYDDTGYFAGIQVSIPQEYFSDAIYDWPTVGFTNWTTTVNGTTKSFWLKNLYVVSDETLATSKEDRLAARDSYNETLQNGFVDASGFNDKLVRIYKNASDMISNNTIFTEQACIPWMGHHYYYNMTNTTECSATTLFPWFPLVYSGVTVGIGLLVPGKITMDNASRNWFENPSRTVVEAIVPKGPECLYALADSPGVVTMHIYFIDKPWLITCFIE